MTSVETQTTTLPTQYEVQHLPGGGTRTVEISKKIHKVTTTEETHSSGRSTPEGMITTRREYHNVDDVPPEARKYLDEFFKNSENRNTSDRVTIIREERRPRPEVVRVQTVNYTKTTDESQSGTPQSSVATDNTKTSHTEKTSTESFTKDMLDQLPEDCRKMVDDLLKSEGIDSKRLDHVTVTTKQEENRRTEETSGPMPSAAPFTSQQPYSKPNSQTPMDLNVQNVITAQDKIQVEIDAKGFEPQDLSMKVCGSNLTVHGVHEGKDPNEPATVIRRELRRNILLPDNIDVERISSKLLPTGMLVIYIPFPEPKNSNIEFNIPLAVE